MSVLRDILRYPDLRTLETDLRNAYQTAYNEELSKTNSSSIAASRAGSSAIVRLKESDKWRINKKTYNFSSYDTAIVLFDALYETNTEVKVKGASSLSEVIGKYFEIVADLAKADKTFSSSHTQGRIISDLVKSPNFSKIFPEYIKHFQEHLSDVIQLTLAKNKSADYTSVYLHALDYFVSEQYIKQEEIEDKRKLARSLEELIEKNVSKELIDIVLNSMTASDLSVILSTLRRKKQPESNLVERSCLTILDASADKLFEVLTVENYKLMSEVVEKFNLEDVSKKLQELNAEFQIVQNQEVLSELEQYTSLLEKKDLTMSDIESFMKSTTSLKTYGCVKHNGREQYSAFLYGIINDVPEEVLKFLYKQSATHSIQFFDFLSHEFGITNHLTRTPSTITGQAVENAVKCYESFNSKSLEKYFDVLSNIRNNVDRSIFFDLTFKNIISKYSKKHLEIKVYDQKTSEMLQPFKDKLLESNIVIVSNTFEYTTHDWEKLRKNEELDEFTRYQLFLKLLQDTLLTVNDIGKNAEFLRNLENWEKACLVQELAQFKENLPAALEALKEHDVLDPMHFVNYNNDSVFSLLLSNKRNFPYLSTFSLDDDSNKTQIKFDKAYNILFARRNFDEKCALTEYYKKFAEFPTTAIQSIIDNDQADQEILDGLVDMVVDFSGAYLGNKQSVDNQFSVAADLDASLMFLKKHLRDDAYKRLIEDIKISLSKSISNNYWIPKSLYDVYSKHIDIETLDLKRNNYRNELSFILTFKLSSAEDLGSNLEDSLTHTLECDQRRDLKGRLLKSEIDDLIELLKDHQLVVDLTQSDLSKFLKKIDSTISEISDEEIIRKLKLCKDSMSSFRTITKLEEDMTKKHKLNF